MNTKILMTSTSLVLALAGALTLFAPDLILTLMNATVTAQLMVLVQLLGALYFSFALMDWIAKDSAIGGIYARPVSLGNFGHFFTGTLVLAKHLFVTKFSLPLLLDTLAYAVFAVIFYWLVFRATGIKQ